MADIFISYKREDRRTAELVDKRLRAEGWTTWWDTSLVAGDHWSEAINTELDAAKCVVVLWSEKSFASRWVQAEAHAGFQRDIVVAGRIDAVELKPPFNIVQTADLRGSAGPAGLDQLVAGVRSKVGAPLGATQAPSPRPPVSHSGSGLRPPQDDGGKSNTTRRLALLGGGVAAVGAGVWAATRGQNTTTATPPPQSAPNAVGEGVPSQLSDLAGEPWLYVNVAGGGLADVAEGYEEVLRLVQAALRGNGLVGRSRLLVRTAPGSFKIGMTFDGPMPAILVGVTAGKTPSGRVLTLQEDGGVIGIGFAYAKLVEKASAVGLPTDGPYVAFEMEEGQFLVHLIVTS